MKILYFILLVVLSLDAYAGPRDNHAANAPAPAKRAAAKANAKSSAGITATVINTLNLQPGKESEVIVKISKKDGTPVLPEDLKTVHTQKIHALVIDPALSDYSHKHPQPTKTPGEYQFTFTPKMPSNYRMWLDITPADSAHQYVMVDLKTDSLVLDGVEKKKVLENTAKQGADTYTFSLSFDDAPETMKTSMGKIHITKNGDAVKNLQPVMGAFGHFVGFYDDYKSIVHTHPMGDEPQSETETGGPDLVFHLEPQQKGFLKLFAQVRINGEDVFVPFGINVE